MKHPQQRHTQAGFTMIELIVVIVILGILSAVALPRFTNLQGDARAAKLNAARGSVAAAMGMVHGSALARQGAPAKACVAGGGNDNIAAATGTGTVCTETGPINVSFLYPAGTAAGIGSAAGVTNNVDNYLVTVAGGVVTFRVVGAVTPATCQFTYTQPAALGAAPVLSNALVAGC
ncbi:MAG: prepilin-type N-terminal cleavage/methylation domain-containing protein [Burkholderiales bacterium]|nr:prepilin-type N-terminal cleavage/methylation domain-containing protein [Burkholderiales bacterium]